jgi:hypothetical protein
MVVAGNDEPEAPVPAGTPVDQAASKPGEQASSATPSPAPPPADSSGNAGEAQTDKRKLFNVRIVSLSENALFAGLVAGIITGLISATAAGYVVYRIQEKDTDVDNLKYALTVKSAVVAECSLMKRRFNYMVKDSPDPDRMNSYLLPNFPNVLVKEISDNTKFYLGQDSSYVSVIDDLGNIDYDSTMSKRDDDGSIYGSPLYDYVESINRLCTWARGGNGDYIDMKPFG